MKTKALILSLSCAHCNAFAPVSDEKRLLSLPSLFGSQPSSKALSPLPKGISPFEKSLSKNLNIQAEFRQQAKRAIDAAISSNVKLIEIEFPPLLGGSQSKSQFDDFDNIQELDKNKDWTMLLAPMFLGELNMPSFCNQRLACSKYYCVWTLTYTSRRQRIPKRQDMAYISRSKRMRIGKKRMGRE